MLQDPQNREKYTQGTPQVHKQAGIRALLVGSAARSGAGYTLPVQMVAYSSVDNSGTGMLSVPHCHQGNGWGRAGLSASCM